MFVYILGLMKIILCVCVCSWSPPLKTALDSKHETALYLKQGNCLWECENTVFDPCLV